MQAKARRSAGVAGFVWRALVLTIVAVIAATAPLRVSAQVPRLPMPAGTVVFVSTEPELQEAMQALESNTTIVLAPGTYWLTSTLTVNGPLSNVAIRGATDNAADVMLTGRGMGNDSFDGVPHGIATGGAVHNLTIANLTIKDVFAHAVMLDVGAESPRLYNLVLMNAGRQLVRAFPDGRDGGVDNGIVEYSIFEYTAARDGDIGGVAVSGGTGWIVRDSIFRSVRAAGGQLAGPAVMMAHGSRNSVIERNTFVDCQREIALGLEDRTPNDHAGGVVRNNFIARAAAVKGGAAIHVADSPGTRVLHNTILTNGSYKTPIEYRFRDAAGVVIANNLLDGEIAARDGATGTLTNNYTKAAAGMFVQPSSGNLHLLAGASEAIDRVPAIADAGSDFDGDARPHGAAADYGADESAFGSGSPGAASPRPAPAARPSAAAPEAAPAAPLPSPWETADVGDPARPGGASWSSDTFAVDGAGSDIGGNADQFRFVYRMLEGDGEIVARVSTLARTDPGAKAGVMIREELTRGAKYAAALVTADKGLLFQRRIANDAMTTVSAGPAGGAPRWVRLVRRGPLFSAFTSADGSRWTPLGRETLYVNRVAYVGLAVTSRSARHSANAEFTDVRLSRTVSSPANSAPQVSITAPAAGSACEAPCSIVISAAASDPDGTIARVDFYAGATLIGSAARAPYSVTWGNVPAGSHTLKAVAEDDAGAAATSAGVAITAIGRVNQPPVVSIGAPAHGASFTEPASIDLIAVASDPDGGRIARVEFFAGSTPIGTVTESPFTLTWREAPAGTYTLSAKAWDSHGASMISSGVNVTVLPGSALLNGWQTGDVGGPMVAGAAAYESATFTVTGGGADIGESADQFRFVYRRLEGDGEISACVASLDYVDSWTKAGVMIREGLAADSPYAFSLLSAGWGLAFHHRSSAGAKSAQAGVAPGLAPHCVRLVRRENVFAAFQSTDGATWAALGSRTIPMGSSVYVGLAVTSHDASRAARAIFNEVVLKSQ